jgi:hypothetical protein
MATQYLPIIQQKDFEAFRRILGNDIPDTYDEWCNFSADRGLTVTRQGHVAISIEADPYEFAAWLATDKTQRGLNGLDNFIWTKRGNAEHD